jgi:hypothetical protein
VVAALEVTDLVPADQVERPHRPGVRHLAEVLLLPLLGWRLRPRVGQLRPQQVDPLYGRSFPNRARSSAQPATWRTAFRSLSPQVPVVPGSTDGGAWQRGRRRRAWFRHTVGSQTGIEGIAQSNRSSRGETANGVDLSLGIGNTEMRRCAVGNSARGAERRMMEAER